MSAAGAAACSVKMTLATSSAAAALARLFESRDLVLHRAGDVGQFDAAVTLVIITLEAVPEVVNQPADLIGSHSQAR